MKHAFLLLVRGPGRRRQGENPVWVPSTEIYTRRDNSRTPRFLGAAFQASVRVPVEPNTQGDWPAECSYGVNLFLQAWVRQP